MLFSKKCHFCKKKIKGKALEAEVKVPGLVGLNKRYFCSQEHFRKYKKFIKEYEKKRKIPMENCTVCTACMK